MTQFFIEIYENCSTYFNYAIDHTVEELVDKVSQGLSSSGNYIFGLAVDWTFDTAFLVFPNFYEMTCLEFAFYGAMFLPIVFFIIRMLLKFLDAIPIVS